MDQVRATLDDLPEPAFTTRPDGEVEHYNPAWFAFTGLSGDGVAGGDVWRRVVHPDDAVEEFPRWTEALATVRPFEGDVRVRRHDGVYRWCRVRARPCTDADGRLTHWAGLLIDVDDVRRLSRELAHRAELLRSLTDNADAALFVMDDRQRCVFMNPAAERLTGFTWDEVLARDEPLHDVIHHHHPDGRPYPLEDCPIDRALPTRAREKGEDVFVHKDGRFYPVAFTASPIVEEGVAVGTVIEVRDITEERARAEERERFLGVLGHDLRNPLSAVAVSLETLRRTGATPAQERVIARAEASVLRMKVMITQLLDLMRARQGGGIPVERAAADVAEVVTRVVEELRPCARRPIRVTVAGPTVARVDVARCEQLFSNLLGNALAYATGEAPVDVTVGGDVDVVTVSFRNDADPIPPEVLDRLFDPFRRGPRDARGPTTQGLGLGLFISREIARAHGGEVVASSTTDEGARFTVILPRGEGA